MRILDQESGQGLSNIILYLTKDEAAQLCSYINQLIEEPDLHHAHMETDNYGKELIVTIYDPLKLAGFDERSKRLILDDN